MIQYKSRVKVGHTMQLCSLEQGTVSPWSIVPRCPRELLVLPTVSDSWDCKNWDIWDLSGIVGSMVGSTSNTLGQRGTMLHGDTVPCPKEQSCIVWTDLNCAIVVFFSESLIYREFLHRNESLCSM